MCCCCSLRPQQCMYHSFLFMGGKRQYINQSMRNFDVNTVVVLDGNVCIRVERAVYCDDTSIRVHPDFTYTTVLDCKTFVAAAVMSNVSVGNQVCRRVARVMPFTILNFGCWYHGREVQPRPANTRHSSQSQRCRDARSNVNSYARYIFASEGVSAAANNPWLLLFYFLPEVWASCVPKSTTTSY